MPFGIKALVALMLWPAIWAGISLASAFASDITRHMRQRMAHRQVGSRPYAHRHS